MTLLAIDAGNTRIKWGIHDGGGWRSTGAILTRESAKLARAWSGVEAKRAIACNVAGPAVAARLKLACKRVGARLKIIKSEAEQLGVINGYRRPSQLGADRWAALIAAHHAAEGHKLVVNVGTALTIDALAGDGRFLGGLIVPGPVLMRRSLDRGTAGLRLTEGEFHDFPRSTPDAITTGSVHACAGAIQRYADVMALSGFKPRIVVLSGGGARDIAGRLPLERAIHDNLVLDGLALIAHRS